jgi:antitoxin component YwqK of YwqJK toxin-antitoxin module
MGNVVLLILQKGSLPKKCMIVMPSLQNTLRHFRKLIVLLFLAQTSCSNSKKHDSIYTRLNDSVIMQKNFYSEGKLKAEILLGNDSVRTGVSKFYYENGALKLQVNFIKDNREGIAKAYHPNGQLMYVGKYSNDLEDSLWVWYHDNGKVRLIAQYDKGERTDTERNFYLDGNINVTSSWDAGKREGVENGYYPNGQLKYTGVYRNDVQDSIWVWYHEDGTFEQNEYWNNGKLICIDTTSE